MAAIVGILPRNKETYSPGLHSAVTQWEDPPSSDSIVEDLVTGVSAYEMSTPNSKTLGLFKGGNP